MNDASTPASVPAPNGRRKIRLIALGLVTALITGGWAAYWYLHGRYYQNTDDAYVAADLVQITNEVSGTVTKVLVDDTQHVERGQLLVELDPADAEVAISEAEAELARSARQVRGVFSQSEGLKAQIRGTEVNLRAARADLARREQVAAEGAVSAEELQHARDQIAELDAALTVRRESLSSTLADIENTSVSTHPAVLAAAARVREAALALQRTRILAPVSGTVARRSVQIGAHITAGTALMSVVPLGEAWVDANFKEVQLVNLRVGQPASLHADVYGSDVEFHGKVVGLGAGSGGAFALLPAQNASGNWIKIVQRLPVRIGLDADELAAHPLRVGLSMKASIDTHDTSGSIVNTQARARSGPGVQTDAEQIAVARRIAEIIAASAGAKTEANGI